MNILTFTTLYPNAVQPGHGIFVETRLRHLVASGAVKARVVAPVPWFPYASPRFGRYALFARVPHAETRNGLDVLHPRYPLLPKIGMALTPWLLAHAVLPVVRRVDEESPFDLIDAHYFYPDGVAAAIIAQTLKKPLVITARGSDLNEIATYPFPRRLIARAAVQADGLVTVCEALKATLVALGVPETRIEVLRNGVDLALFRPVDRAAQRRTLGLSGRTLLSVGRLVVDKGHDVAIRALAKLVDATLLIAGEGPEERNLRALADANGLSQRVKFLGALPQPALRDYYGAVDALVLASNSEGWANVLLEAMACGTPVIASDVGGTAEVVASPCAGVLMGERTPDALAEAANRLFANYPAHGDTRRYAERFAWDETTNGQLELFGRIRDARRTSAMQTGRHAKLSSAI